MTTAPPPTKADSSERTRLSTWRKRVREISKVLDTSICWETWCSSRPGGPEATPSRLARSQSLSLSSGTTTRLGLGLRAPAPKRERRTPRVAQRRERPQYVPTSQRVVSCPSSSPYSAAPPGARAAPPPTARLIARPVCANPWFPTARALFYT